MFLSNYWSDVRNFGAACVDVANLDKKIVQDSKEKVIKHCVYCVAGMLRWYIHVHVDEKCNADARGAAVVLWLFICNLF